MTAEQPSRAINEIPELTGLEKLRMDVTEYIVFDIQRAHGLTKMESDSFQDIFGNYDLYTDNKGIKYLLESKFSKTQSGVTAKVILYKIDSTVSTTPQVRNLIQEAKDKTGKTLSFFPKGNASSGMGYLAEEIQSKDFSTK